MQKSVFALFLLLSFSLSAQTIKSVGKTSRWMPYNDDVCLESAFGGPYTPTKKLIRVSATEIITPVAYDNSSGAFVFDRAKLKYGVVKLNSGGQQQWEQKKLMWSEMVGGDLNNGL